jgi:hypothetical protein
MSELKPEYEVVLVKPAINGGVNGSDMYGL